MEFPTAGPNGETGGSNDYPSIVYERMEAYEFTADPEFKLGLAALLHQETPATDEQVNGTDDLVLQAKCFYFSRKHEISPYIGLDRYKVWKQAQEQQASGVATEATNGTNGTETTNDNAGTAANDVPASNGNPAPTATTTAATATAAANNNINAAAAANQPSYPSSFAHIVELITTGQSIPGIQQIPDTVLTGHGAPSAEKQRRKPWETEEPEDVVTNGDHVNGVASDQKNEDDDDPPAAGTASGIAT